VSRYAITGTTGLVGGALRRWLQARGHEVRGLDRAPGRAGPRFVLGEPIAFGTLAGVDALVHCAYDWRPRAAADIERVNVAGSLALFQAAQAAGIRRRLFVSSISAWEGGVSRYGRAKLAVECAVRAAGAVVVRPGLVWGGEGRGVFAGLARVAGLPVLPLFDGGRQPFFLVHADDLAALLARAVDSASAGGPPITAAHPQPLTFRALLERLAARRGRRPRFMPVPGALALVGLRAAEALGMDVGFRSDSLLGLLHANPAPDWAPQAALNLYPRPFAG
jgi:nucleoside-diphosphate-sugar epimerase